MHQESYAAVADFVYRFARPGMRVADVGAFDVNGTFRPLFGGFEYVGIDMTPGPNVDRVVDPYDFGDGGFNIVVSGNSMEHVEDLRRWAAACLALLVPGGFLCITVPHGTSGFTEHRHPVDCWRVWPDGMRWLFRDMEILECRTDARDTVMIARRRSDDIRSKKEILETA